MCVFVKLLLSGCTICTQYLYVCVQRLAQFRPLGVQLYQPVDVTALGRLLQAKSQRYSGAVAPPHKMSVLIF